ncbi:hypothetical protein PR202_ga07944 [Eleusine coracana subsp. coracana]|uniref:Uncharacterized protein n=1 Tax=Eleusine coracana subsp. coracana TaxID=191504 RepID=A0AAV5C028_ELECO|nr:hypothetical protein QOZ80_2AG0118070 [Eleusine coracana subsp. coracana]GJM91562.1 hypothetical protein PR202_ga07944 [Eleusine coracana subsp. coracana]
MEIAACMEGQPRRREHWSGGSRFRAEIETDLGSPSISRGPGYGFAAAVREPLVRLQRPKFDFEIWDWGYFAWPHDRLDANLEMRDSDPEATLEADRKASESFLNHSTDKLERYAMDHDTQEQLQANLEIRDSNPEVTFEADTKASEGFQNWSMLQLERCAMDQCTPEQNAMTLPRNKLRGNQGMGDCNQKGTPKSDQKAIESLLSRSTLQLKRREMDQDQHAQEQQKEPEPRTSLLLDGKPVGRRSTRRRRGCAEANGILDHGRAMQGSWAC